MFALVGVGCDGDADVRVRWHDDRLGDEKQPRRHHTPTWCVMMAFFMFCIFCLLAWYEQKYIVRHSRGLARHP